MINKIEMMNNTDYKNCLYYQGEQTCPFRDDDGRTLWWSLEKISLENKDTLQKGNLTTTMKAYFQEKVWEPERNVPLEVCFQRATELYLAGGNRCAYAIDARIRIEEC